MIACHRRVSAFAAGAALIALFNVALRGSRRAMIAIDGARLRAAAAIAHVVSATTEVPFVLEVLLSVLFTLVVIPWGLFTRTQRDLLRRSHERARQLEAEQRAHVEQAREAERRRIAGEMHDVLAHRLSLLRSTPARSSSGRTRRRRRSPRRPRVIRAHGARARCRTCAR